MAAWTYAPAILTTLSTNELDTVFKEVILAIQRREEDLRPGGVSAWVPAVTNPCTLASVQGNQIPWTYDDAAYSQWLTNIHDKIDDLIGTGAWHPWQHSINMEYRFCDNTGAFYTQASIKTAAFGAAAWYVPPLPGDVKLYAIRKILYEAMKVLELMNRVYLYGAENAPYMWADTICWENSVPQTTVAAAFANLDTKTTSKVGRVVYTGQACDRNTAPSPDEYTYYVQHLYLRLGSEFDSEMPLWGYSTSPKSHFRTMRWLDETGTGNVNDFTLDLYGGAVDWPPALIWNDFPATGGTKQDDITVGSATGYDILEMNAAVLPVAPGDAYYYIDCDETTQYVTAVDAGQTWAYAGAVYGGGTTWFRIIYDLDSAYDPTG